MVTKNFVVIEVARNTIGDETNFVAECHKQQ